MNPVPLHRLLAGTAAGIFRLGSPAPWLGHRCQLEGLHLDRVKLAHCANRHALLQATARALRFPGWFGGNWDALYDALTDLDDAEARGRVLLLDGLDRLARTDPNACAVFLHTLEDAALYFAGEGQSFLVLVPGRSATLDRLLRQALGRVLTALG